MVSDGPDFMTQWSVKSFFDIPSVVYNFTIIFSVEHVNVDHGTCTSVSKADCQQIAESRGIEMYVTNNIHRPIGCYHKQSSNHMWYNTSPTGVDCHADRVCVCKPPGKL